MIRPTAKSLLIGLSAALAIMAGAQTPDAHMAAVKKYAEDANKVAPSKISDALTQKSVAIVGSDMIFDWTVEHDEAFARIKEKRDLVRDAKVAELSMTEPSENQMAYFLKVANVNLVYNLANKAATDTVTIRISKHDLY